jgi:hypothetical protein
MMSQSGDITAREEKLFRGMDEWIIDASNVKDLGILLTTLLNFINLFLILKPHCLSQGGFLEITEGNHFQSPTGSIGPLNWHINSTRRSFPWNIQGITIQQLNGDCLVIFKSPKCHLGIKRSQVTERRDEKISLIKLYLHLQAHKTKIQTGSVLTSSRPAFHSLTP